MRKERINHEKIRSEIIRHPLSGHFKTSPPARLRVCGPAGADGSCWTRRGSVSQCRRRRHRRPTFARFTFRYYYFRHPVRDV